MNRWLHNLNVAGRRAVLSAILLVPERWRAALARNPLLVRVYEVFDRAKYEETFDADSWDRRDAPGWNFRPAIDHSAYVFHPPEWTEAVRERLAQAEGPVISVLVPVYNTPVDWLRPMVESVQAQWYPHWELCLVDDHSDREETLAYLETLEDPRIRIRRLPENRHIAGASEAALGLATGEYVALLDHDDELTPDALYRVWEAIDTQQADFIYSDEDKIDENGAYCDPHFKPDYAPDHILSQNYICHLTTLRRSLAEEAGGFLPGFDGAQDHDLFLRALERTDRVVHIPRVLYHWRKVPGSTAAQFDEKSYAQRAGERAVQAAMDRRGIRADVGPGRYPGTYRVRPAIDGEPLVSIVIPFKDKPELLETSIGGILEVSTWRNFEVIGISNNSEAPATFEAMEALAARDARVRFTEHNVPFNYSAINNYAVRELARGEHVILCNNDVEIITPDWIECLLEFSQRDDVGVVGAKLYYPDNRIQHAGVVVGIRGAAGHGHKRFDREDPGYKARPHLNQNVSAVTAALFMVKRDLFMAVGGLEEERLRIAFNDIDFCLRVRERGLLNVFTPYCEAWHHESLSRGYEDTEEKKARFWREVEYFRERHAGLLDAGDPFYNPNLTLWHENFDLADTAKAPAEPESA